LCPRVIGRGNGRRQFDTGLTERLLNPHAREIRAVGNGVESGTVRL
jgi:hypothetical protein